MDNFGVVTMVVVRRDSTERGKRFVIHGATGQVRDQLPVTGMENRLREPDQGRLGTLSAR